MMNSMNNASGFSLKAKLQAHDTERRIAELLATGRFQDTGAKYTPAQAQQDAHNAALRMTFKVDKFGKLYWVKD
jgi:hypothetical protein